MNKISENGAKILTGKGLDEVRQRIVESFRKANEQGITGKVTPKQPAPQARDLSTKQSHIPYSEADARNFQLRGDMLMGAARSVLHRHKSHSYYAGNIEKNYTADEVIAEALQPAKTESKKERRHRENT